MTADQIRLVKRSFASIAPRRDRAAALFFDHLLALDPTLRLLFPGDLSRRGLKVMSAVEQIVNDLHRVHIFAPALEALAVRHFGYGLELAHFAVIGEALKATAAQLLGEAFNPEVEAAVEAAYANITHAMIEALRFDLPLAA